MKVQYTSVKQEQTGVKKSFPQSDKKTRHNLFGFTLVELIVSISILTILGTISMVSINNFYGNARDSVRINDMKSLQKGLTILQLKMGSYFLPANALEISAHSGTTIFSYQGYIGEEISRVIKMNTTPLDPKDLTRYVYTVDKNFKKAQLMGYLESEESSKISAHNMGSKNIADIYSGMLYKLGDIPYVYAGGPSNVDYANRFIYVIGDTIGVLTRGDKGPIQESSLATGTGMNLSSVDTTGMIAYFGGTTYGKGYSTGTGDILIAQMGGAMNNTVPCNPSSYSGYTISALAHGEIKSFNKLLTIGNGSGSSSLQIGCFNGSLDMLQATETSTIICNGGYVNNGSNICIADICGSAPTYSISNGMQKVNTSWTHNIAGGGYCTFVCQGGHYWNSTSCTQASIGYYVGNSGSTVQTGCLMNNTYQDTPAQTYCKTVSSGYYSSPIGVVAKTSQVLCEVNTFCINGVKTACATGYSSLAGSTSCTDQTPPTMTSVTVTTTASQPACNTVRFTINGATDTIGLHATPYSFDGGSTWQAGNTKDYTSVNQTITANQIKVRDTALNVYTYANSTTGSSSACTCNLPWGGAIVNGASVTAYQNSTYACGGSPVSQTRTCNNGTLGGNYTNQSSTQNACPVTGSCGGSANSCGAGSAGGYAAGSCNGYQTWTCYGANGGGNASCSIANAACAVNCSYTTYTPGTCSASCGGGTYVYYYTITSAASGGGTCAVSQGQYAYDSGSCNTQACAPSCYWGMPCSTSSCSANGLTYYKYALSACGINWQGISVCDWNASGYVTGCYN